MKLKVKELWDKFSKRTAVGNLMYWDEFCEAIKELEENKNHPHEPQHQA